MSQQKEKTIIAGAMITAGSIIGAGIFSLPIVSSGMWFLLSLCVIAALWYLNFLISMVLLEVNCHYPPGASFDTFVDDILGKAWNVLAGIGVGFLMYILLYAYFSAFGSMASHTLSLSEDSRMSSGLLGLLAGLIFASMVWKSTTIVMRISTILVIAMVGAYLLSMFGLSLNVEFANLFNHGQTDPSYTSYIWMALPYYLTAFGFASLVPSLYKFYGKEPEKIRKSIRLGSLVALAIYVVFIIICFGVISRSDYMAINAAGGNMGDLVAALTKGNDQPSINLALSAFSNFAIISSFFGVSLGLFDYIADLCDFSDDGKGRFRTACLTFLPPGVASFFFPHGFIVAIGYAGIAMAFSYVLVPLLMIWKVRATRDYAGFRLWGGKPMLLVIFFCGAVIVLCQILAALDYLPVY